MDRCVKVFMPCFNCEKYVEEAIASILSQTYPDFQLVVLDDGSSDGSVDIIKKMMRRDKRIFLIEEPVNKGIVSARNKGLVVCDCDYLALMDADDISSADRLEKEIEYLEHNPNVIVVGGQYQLIDEEGRALQDRRSALALDAEEIRAQMVFENSVANGSVMMRKKCIDAWGIRYRQECSAAEDYRFWSEVLRHGDICNLDEVLQYYRIHSGSLEYQSTKSDQMRRSQGIYDTKKSVLETLGIKLPPIETDVFLKVLMGEVKLSVRERLYFLRAAEMLKQQVRVKGAGFARNFMRYLSKYEQSVYPSVFKLFL